MGDKTGIEWCDATWNPTVGCSVVSPGCTNCYAMKMADRLEAISVAHTASHGGDPGPTGIYEGLTTRGEFGTKPPAWTGTVRLNPSTLTAPLRWKRPRRIFVNSMSDLFHERLPDADIDKVFAIMALAPQHTFMVLTKRAERMRSYCSDGRLPGRLARLLIDKCLLASTREWPFSEATWPVRSSGDIDMPKDVTVPWPLPNLWLGVSVEDQVRADERVPHLLATPAAVRFISAEPLLGPLDLTWVAEPNDEKDGVIDALLGCNWIDGWGRGTRYEPSRAGHAGRRMTREVVSINDSKIDWVICGGESGPNARPMHLDWARSLRDQCRGAGVPFFFKQWGEWGRAEDWPSEVQEDYDVRGLTAPDMIRVGKKRAGRLLDGREWNEVPA